MLPFTRRPLSIFFLLDGHFFLFHLLESFLCDNLQNSFVNLFRVCFWVNWALPCLLPSLTSPDEVATTLVPAIFDWLLPSRGHAHIQIDIFLSIFIQRRRVDEKPAFPVPKCAQCGALSNRLHVVLDERPTVLCFEHLQAYFKVCCSRWRWLCDLMTPFLTIASSRIRNPHLERRWILLLARSFVQSVAIMSIARTPSLFLGRPFPQVSSRHTRSFLEVHLFPLCCLCEVSSN